MVVIVLENVPKSLRGEISRWLFEVKAGVFTGKISALVRDDLWEHITEKVGEEGSALMIHSANTEQGFRARMAGERRRSLEDIEGVLLVKIQ
ncbi:MAG: type I-E CRISPR-associated endoribonuclease Cas2 [Cyanothece sp. SIO2G6]|nr:type I-E CRISPR-associated endoribonuclease Cas2 [Cyanothece sp. SIO2G6]